MRSSRQFLGFSRRQLAIPKLLRHCGGDITPVVTALLLVGCLNAECVSSFGALPVDEGWGGVGLGGVIWANGAVQEFVSDGT